MGDGLQRATLDALCSRGAWHGNPDGVAPWTLTGDELRRLYHAIAAGSFPPEEAIGCVRGHRKADRAFQILRRAGLIRVARPTRRWVVATDDEVRGHPARNA